MQVPFVSTNVYHEIVNKKYPIIVLQTNDNHYDKNQYRK
jgi:hypothetical protein